MEILSKEVVHSCDFPWKDEERFVAVIVDTQDDCLYAGGYPIAEADPHHYQPLEVDGLWLSIYSYDESGRTGWHVVDTQTKPVDTQETKQKLIKESNDMPKKALTTLVKDSNVSAAKTAAVLKVGKTATTAAVKIITPTLPIMVRGYMDSVIGRLVVANLASVAVNQVASDNPKAVLVAQAMVDAVAVEIFDKVDIDAFIDEFTKGIDTSSLEKFMKKDVD